VSGILHVFPGDRPVYTSGVDIRRSIGQAAEEAATRHLRRAGLTVVARNVRLPGGELDLVCRDGDRWVFVEVKCRRARWGDAPGAAVSAQKQRRLVRLAQHYLKREHLGEPRCRFDVVAVTLNEDGASDVRHIPSAFDASPV
jgi:putative endonuclease